MRSLGLAESALSSWPLPDDFAGGMACISFGAWSGSSRLFGSGSVWCVVVVQRPER